MKNKEKSVENLRKLIGCAIRSKMETERIYSDLAVRVKSIFMRERLKFLAREEEAQRKSLEKLAYQMFGKDIEIPENSGLPIPELGNIGDDIKMPLNELIEILEKAKTADKETMDMYISMSEFFEEDSPEKRLLDYLTYLEEDHYYLLERKIIKLQRFGVV